jgi:hypothetical protein
MSYPQEKRSLASFSSAITPRYVSHCYIIRGKPLADHMSRLSYYPVIRHASKYVYLARDIKRPVFTGITIDFGGFIALLLGKPFAVVYPYSKPLLTGGSYCTVLQEARQTFCRKSRVTGTI